MSDNNKLKIGIYELTGCAGDALLILDCEMELIDIFNAVNIQSFLMAKSDNIDGELDIALVEGSVTTEREIEELKDIRKRSSYGDTEMTHTKAVPSKPIDAYIDVDFYLPGCPVGKDQFLNFFTRVVQGSPPESYPVPVCVTCKYNENDCLLKKGIPCLGPLTADGCGSVCPNYGVPCYGCWGPAEGANLTSEYYLLQEKGFDIEAIQRRMSNYSGTKLQDFFEQFKNKEPK
jgi:sulfhydrogenase subunit delta